MLHLHRAIVVALAVSVLAACGDDSTGPPPEFVGLRILVGGSGTDTISTQFTQALVVELRDEKGEPVPDHVLRFETVPVDPSQQFGGYTAYISPVDRNDQRTFMSDTTDAQGRARALVRLGLKAGPGIVIITDPDVGASDTATFTVQPGRAVRVQAAPRDTAIYVGSTATLRSSVVDRAGNPRPDPVTHAVIGSAVTVSGATVSAGSLGFARVVTSAGTMSDTTNVAVPPDGTLAAFSNAGLAAFKTDGSGFQVLAPGAAFRGRTLSWSPAGTEVAFDQEFGERIQIASVAGGVRFVTPAGSGTLYPRFSRDGQWVYYTRLSRLQRVRPDGTGEEPVPIVNAGIDASPAFSPDGSRAVIVRLFGNQLLMLDLATGATTDLGSTGQTPAWSPTGNLIAFVGSGDGNTIKVMNPDGTGVRTVASANAPYAIGIDWTSDGQWIVARSAGRDRVELINATSGEVIPLSYTRGYTGGASWKP
jgi:hypothetical protein